MVQEVFLSLLTQGAKFDGRSRVTSWLHRVVTNRALDVRRKERRHWGEKRTRRPSEGAPREAPGGVPGPATRAASSSSADPDEPPGERVSAAPGPEESARLAERSEAVRSALALLSPRLAEVVVLRYLQDLSYEEIGAALDLPPGTVKSRLARAHDALRDLLGDLVDES